MSNESQKTSVSTGVSQPRTDADVINLEKLPVYVLNSDFPLSDPLRYFSAEETVPSEITGPRLAKVASRYPTNVGKLARTGNGSVAPVIEMPAPRRMAVQRSQVLQQWRGTVQEVGTNSFGARLQDLSSESLEEWATLSFDDINEDDKILVKPGAVFYWSIGYLTEPYGQRRTASTIYFKRSPNWSPEEHARAHLIADSYRSIFDDDLSK